MYIATYDPATDAVSEGIKLSSTLTNGGYYNIDVYKRQIRYGADGTGYHGYHADQLPI